MNTSKQINVMILLVFLSVLITGGYTLWDQSRADEAEGEQLEKTVWRGAWLFSQNCRTCHGDAGEGGAASNRLRQAPALNREDLQGLVDGVRDPIDYANDFKFVYYTITCGRVGKVMPAWGQSQGGTLNEEQIKQLTTLILNGAIPYEQLTEPNETPEEGDESGEESADPQSGWEQAAEFARHGAPEFHELGDDRDDLALESDVAEGDTTIVLNRVESVTIGEDGEETRAPLVVANDRLAILDEDGKVAEIIIVQSVNAEAHSISVERGVGTTDAQAFTAGTDVVHQPALSEGQIVERSCGQTAAAPQQVERPDPATQLSITAQGTAWNTPFLSAIAGQPLTITVQNNDDGVAHNWHLTEGAEPGGDDVATTDIENGVVTQTLDFGPLTAGDYYYVCDVHPQMEGVLTAYAPGTGPDGSATPAAGGTATTPAAGAGTPTP
jgi:mono/diheme cytochrome c family protein/plastocyanin